MQQIEQESAPSTVTIEKETTLFVRIYHSHYTRGLDVFQKEHDHGHSPVATRSRETQPQKKQPEMVRMSSERISLTCRRN
jgi:hypothetical protein